MIEALTTVIERRDEAFLLLSGIVSRVYATEGMAPLMTSFDSEESVTSFLATVDKVSEEREAHLVKQQRARQESFQRAKLESKRRQAEKAAEQANALSALEDYDELAETQDGADETEVLPFGPAAAPSLLLPPLVCLFLIFFSLSLLIFCFFLGLRSFDSRRKCRGQRVGEFLGNARTRFSYLFTCFLRTFMSFKIISFLLSLLQVLSSLD